MKDQILIRSYSTSSNSNIKLDNDLSKPRKRLDCFSIPRPCPFVTCYYNLYAEWSGIRGRSKRSGKKTKLVRNLISDPMKVPPDKSCVLDIAMKGGLTLEEVGFVMDLTRERVRQIQFSCVKKISHSRELKKFITSEVYDPAINIVFPDENLSISDLDIFLP